MLRALCDYHFSLVIFWEVQHFYRPNFRITGSKLRKNGKRKSNIPVDLETRKEIQVLALSP